MQRALGNRAPSRAGGILLEFALIALAAYLLLAGALTLGRALAVSQGAQDTARVAARELALVRLPATLTFEEALAYQDPVTLAFPVRERVFDPGLLALDLGVFNPEVDLASLPVVNRAFYGLMVREGNLLHVPGALVQDASFARPFNPNGFSVVVPVVTGRAPDTGVETIAWRGVLEEVRPDPGNPATGPFSVTSPDGGVVAVRVNVPAQSASLVQMMPAAGVNTQLQAVSADDAGVTAPPPPVGSLSQPAGALGPYGGSYGLGRLEAYGKPVRPFRRLISAQAVFRREVVQDFGI